MNGNTIKWNKPQKPNLLPCKEPRNENTVTFGSGAYSIRAAVYRQCWLSQAFRGFAELKSSSIKGDKSSDDLLHLWEQKLHGSHADDLRISYMGVSMEERNNMNKEREKERAWGRQNVDISSQLGWLMHIFIEAFFPKSSVLCIVQHPPIHTYFFEGKQCNVFISKEEIYWRNVFIW